MDTLPGNVVDIIRRTIQDIINQRGKCPVATLMLGLRKRNDRIFRPDNWAGYPKPRRMLEAESKLFNLAF